MRDRRHIIISGPSGCGKSTIVKKLVASNPLFIYSVSHTTRPKRVGEHEGLDYYFIDKKMFLDKIYKNEFIEYAIYNNHYYGTSVAQFENQKKIMIIDLERQGVEYLMQAQYDFRYIFIYCSKREQMKRLLNRSRVEIMSLSLLRDISNRIDEYDKDITAKERGIYDLVVENVEVEYSLNLIDEFIYEHEVVKKDADDHIYNLDEQPLE